jgi:hypothetical protein
MAKRHAARSWGVWDSGAASRRYTQAPAPAYARPCRKSNGNSGATRHVGAVLAASETSGRVRAGKGVDRDQEGQQAPSVCQGSRIT